MSNSIRLMPVFLLFAGACSNEFKNDADDPVFGDDTGEQQDSTTDGDRDGDGVRAADGDCNDSDSAVYPGAVEICDGLDNDCDGEVDDVAAADLPTWYLDFDGDGYGGTSHTIADCDAPSGYVSDATDCDDAQLETHPGASEICDGVDNDCNGSVDDGATLSTWYEDWDSDGYGDPNVSQESCEQPGGYVLDDSDCNDVNDDIHPGATETCNNIDDDCNGTADEPPVSGGTTWYEDWDSDGYGDPNVSQDACTQPSGYVANSSDCNDVNGSIYPEAIEISDGLDNNCDGSVDESSFDTPVTISDWVSDYGQQSAVGVDSYGQVHVVYFDAVYEGVRYNVRDSGGSWDSASDLVWNSGHAAGVYLDAVMDGQDRFQVAYTYDDDGGGDQELWFTYVESNGSFGNEIEIIGSSGTDSTGFDLCIDVDSSNLPSIAYYDDDDELPYVIDCSALSGACYYTAADDHYFGETGLYPSLAVDSANYNHVVYFDPNAWSGFSFSDEIQYSRLDSALNSYEWSEEIVEAEPYTLVVDVKSNNAPCVAYYEYIQGDLLYTCLDTSSGNWDTPVTLDSTGEVGMMPSMAFNSNDEAYIAYYDLSQGNLKLAREVNGSWSISTLDTSGDVGVNPSIAIDAYDEVYVTYYDVTNQALKLVEGR